MSAAANITETNYNTKLAEMLEARLPRWTVVPQATNVLQNASKEPDVFIELPSGLPLILECKYDEQGSLAQVESDAKGRLGQNTKSLGRLVEQSIAVLYPPELKTHAGPREQALAAATLKFAVFSMSEPGKHTRFPEADWLEGGIDDLADFVENVAVSEQMIREALDHFTNAINAAASRLTGLRLASRTESKLGDVLHQAPGEQTTRMAMAILLNAMVFQSTVAANHDEVESISQLAAKARQMQRTLSQNDVLTVWQYILTDINYWPIFAIATEILFSIDDEAAAASMLQSLANSVDHLVQLTAQTVQDLAGQIFGRLISDRKFLATFYTLPASATLLAELAVSQLDVNWSDDKAVTSLKIADFACGTGALLSAAYRQVSQRYRRTGGNDEKIHRGMLENVLIGADIMPAAVHITASMLSSVHPNIDYTSTLTHVMPYGEQTDNTIKIGSLHLIKDNEAQTLFGDGSRVLTNVGEEEHSTLSAPHGELDLVIMNPPFTSSTGDQRTDDVPMPAFAGFGSSKIAQAKMVCELNKIYKGIDEPTAKHGNAGLATNFIDLAVIKAKAGGVVAFVLPSTFAAGDSWEKSRETIAKKCENVYVISIAAPTAKKSSFSADTNLAEVLVVATRREEDITDNYYAEEDWRWVSLTDRPSLPVVAVEISKQIAKFQLGEQKIGETYGATMNKAKFGISLEQMANFKLMEIVMRMELEMTPEFVLPGAEGTFSLNLCPLGDIGDVGPLGRDINEKNRGPFDTREKPKGRVHYPILWNAKGARETRLVVTPDTEGTVKKGMENKAAQLWLKSTHLHFSGHFGLNSQRLVACFTEERCLGGGGGTWFSILLSEKSSDQPKEKMEWVYPTLLWCNTTLGLLSRWMHGTKQQPGRSIITKSRFAGLKVLNPRTLTVKQLQQAKEIFEEFKDKEFLPANEAYHDETRIALDKAVFVELLGQPEETMKWLEVVRDQWCREPTVHGGKSTQPGNQS